MWTPYDPAALDVTNKMAPPWTDGHLLGTDQLGRDVVAQLMAGALNSLLVAVLSTAGAVVLGVALGLTAAGGGRFWSDTLTRATDVAIALPGILVALVLATFFGPSNTTAIVAIVVWFVPGAARIVIGPARQVLAREFVEAAMAYGRSRSFVLFRHVLPNLGPLIIVMASMMFAGAILTEAALSYLGLGAQRPTPSWGRLLFESQSVIGQAPSLVVFPGVCIMLAVLGFNLLGDGLRSRLDPRHAREVVV
ncbi:ABC transporter permease [Jiangella muralis]|uniref:ABC transporter permease n=1 Tax=Jiangella muralis TaxID=702383 RepID=UPI001F0A84EF|nr:ABC transporter permease [Jiangella muralis]